MQRTVPQSSHCEGERIATHSPDRSDIVADGPLRIREGCARRLKARLTRRTAELYNRANFLGRLVIRFRIRRFVRRRLAKLAPWEALYSTSRITN